MYIRFNNIIFFLYDVDDDDDDDCYIAIIMIFRHHHHFNTNLLNLYIQYTAYMHMNQHLYSIHE